VTPDGLEDFVDLVVPIARRLQARLPARHLAREAVRAIAAAADEPPAEYRRLAAVSC
jgi:hypothetical protein